MLIWRTGSGVTNLCLLGSLLNVATFDHPVRLKASSLVDRSDGVESKATTLVMNPIADDILGSCRLWR